MQHVDDVYVTDAYHSLSIEGYRVSTGLIERVRNQSWNPDNNEDDREQRNALAARGYYLAYQVVRDSVTRVLKGENPGTVVDETHRTWYRELFRPALRLAFCNLPTLLATVLIRSISAGQCIRLQAGTRYVISCPRSSI